MCIWEELLNVLGFSSNAGGCWFFFAAGAIMEEQAAKHLGVKMCKFVPKHSRNLANEFRCYVNYASGLD